MSRAKPLSEDFYVMYWCNPCYLPAGGRYDKIDIIEEGDSEKTTYTCSKCGARLWVFQIPKMKFD